MTRGGPRAFFTVWCCKGRDTAAPQTHMRHKQVHTRHKQYDPGGPGHFSLQGEGHCCSSNTHETQANTNETQAIWPGGAQGIFHCSISLEEGHCCSSNTNETVRHKLTLKIQQTNMHFSLLDPTLWDVRPQTHRRQKLTLKRNSNNKIAFIELSKLCFGVKTKLFNVSGKRVKEMMYAFAQDCLRSNSKKWNGRQKQTN